MAKTSSACMETVSRIRMDAESTEFALYLLIPTEFLKDELEKLGPHDIDDERYIDALSKKFRVTRGVVHARLRLFAKDEK